MLHLFYLEYCTAAIITNLTSTVLLFSLSNISKASVILLWISAMRESVKKITHTKYTCRYKAKCFCKTIFVKKKTGWLLQFRIYVTCNYTYFNIILFIHFGWLNQYRIEKIGLSLMFLLNSLHGYKTL